MNKYGVFIALLRDAQGYISDQDLRIATHLHFRCLIERSVIIVAFYTYN